MSARATPKWGVARADGADKAPPMTRGPQRERGRGRETERERERARESERATVEGERRMKERMGPFSGPRWRRKCAD